MGTSGPRPRLLEVAGSPHVSAWAVQHHLLSAIRGQYGILMSSVKVFLYPKARKYLRNIFVFLTLLSAAKREWKDRYWSPDLTLQARLLLCLADLLNFFHDDGGLVPRADSPISNANPLLREQKKCSHIASPYEQQRCLHSYKILLSNGLQALCWHSRSVPALTGFCLNNEQRWVWGESWVCQRLSSLRAGYFLHSLSLNQKNITDARCIGHGAHACI